MNRELPQFCACCWAVFFACVAIGLAAVIGRIL